MRTHWKKAASAGLCACLVLASLAGCSKKDDFDAQATAITVNGDAVPAGVVKFASHYLQARYETMYASFGYTGIINQDIYGTGSTLGESLKEQMVEELTHLTLAKQHMDEYGVSLSEEQKSAISEAAETFLAENGEEVLERMAATQETVEGYLELLTIQTLMEAAMAEDVDTEVSDEEAAQRRVTYALFTPPAEEETETEPSLVDEEETASLTENERENTQAADETEDGALVFETELDTELETEPETEDPERAAAMAEAYAKAQELIGRLQAGEDFETATDEVDPDASFGSFTFGEGDADYRAELLAATDGLADGTLVDYPVETDSGYYVIRLDTQLDRAATDSEKENIVQQRKSDRIAELYSEWEENGEISTDEEVLSSITFDFSLTVQTEPQTEASDSGEAAAAEPETE